MAALITGETVSNSPSGQITPTNWQFHKDSRATLRETCTILLQTGPGAVQPTSQAFESIVGNILAFAGKDAYGERRRGVYKMLQALMKPRPHGARTVMLCFDGKEWCFRYERQRTNWDETIQQIVQHDEGIIWVKLNATDCYDEYGAKFSNSTKLLDVLDCTLLNTPTALWGLTDVVPGALAKLMRCRTCGIQITTDDICEFCARKLWSTPCDVCGSLVGTRPHKRRCVAHNWQEHYNEEASDVESDE